MDWLITALSALREIRDYRGRSRLVPQPETAPASKVEPQNLSIAPIGPALDTSRVTRMQPRTNGSQKTPQPQRRREPPRGPPPHSGNGSSELEPPHGGTDLPHDKIDRDALDVVRRLKKHGHVAYLVGGCVRDLSLGLMPKDFDIATSAKPEEIRAVFRNCRIIGRRFRLAHIYFRGGKIFETSTFRAHAGPVEAEDGSDEPQDLLIRHDNVFGSAEEDARRRDFTINGLFYDPSKGKIIDYVGGIADLKTRTVRMIGNPDIRLREDPVRVLRAVRIAAKTGLTIDPELLSAMRRHKGEITRCARPRVLEETMRLFRTGHAEKSLLLLDETCVLDVVLPQINAYLESLRSAGEDDRVELIMRVLRALDERVRRGPVSDVVVMAALYHAPMTAILERAEPGQRSGLMTRLILEAAAEIGATRKMIERLRQIMITQRHFERPTGNRRGKRKLAPSALVSRVYFAEALDLFEILSAAQGHGMEELAFWRDRAREVDPDASEEPERTEEAPARGSRRRRRRRPKGSDDRTQPATTE
jgi:poly(A) polymerase